MRRKIFIWLAAFILALFLLDAGYSFFLRHNLNIKSSYVFLRKIDADILILGSCEAQSAVIPAVMDTVTGKRTYNLATNHASFSENYLHLYLYLQNNRPPEKVLLQISPETCDDRFNFFKAFLFTQLMSDPEVRRVIADRDPFYRMLCIFPMFEYAMYNNYFTFHTVQGAKHYMNNRALPYDSTGYDYTELDMDVYLDKFLTEYPEGTEYFWDKEEEEYLNKIIALTRQCRTQLILFESPVWNGILKYMKNKAEINRIIAQIAEKNNVVYVRFEDTGFCGDRNNFVNYQRLSRGASVSFTTNLAGKIGE
ncbi:MAG: hypothetical protein KJ607_03265 [Bacteroidetes bacterium]|nr:hypothetical protein [Bacteroidota bacterium]